MSTVVNAHDFLRLCDFDKAEGLIPVVAQDAKTKDVLMVAYTNREALEKTLESGTMYYQSRSRGLWHKGETSGAFQHVISLSLDCDNDTVLALVNPEGPACHRGSVTCFTDSVIFRKETND